MASIIVTGLGTAVPQMYNYIFYIMGGGGFVWLLGMMVRALWVHRAEDAEESLKLKSTPAEVSRGAQGLADERKLKDLLTPINTSGAMSTFAAGYLYYNVVTLVKLYSAIMTTNKKPFFFSCDPTTCFAIQDTDVFRLTSKENDVDLIKLFIAANVLTVILSFISAVQDSVLTLLANDLRTNEFRIRFLQKLPLLYQTCSWFYKFSLCGWFLVFALFGLIKYNRYSYVPIWYAVAGTGGLVIGEVRVDDGEVKTTPHPLLLTRPRVFVSFLEGALIKNNRHAASSRCGRSVI